ncbi:MAG: ANTAR domain-containing protein [Oscillospiraceae bacterium]|nr:ANTAR domain-containing protein [Oscillospiraceae bacterium]
MGKQRILFVSGSQKAAEEFAEFLTVSIGAVVDIQTSAADVSEMLARKTPPQYDCCVLNIPLADEFGNRTAVQLAQRTKSQILVLSPREHDAQLRAKLQSHGVMILQKPIGKQALLMAIQLTECVQIRIENVALQSELTLQEKLSEMKLIQRAKLVLISRLGLTEPQAQRHLEKQAMNLRITKREVAMNVLNLYED